MFLFSRNYFQIFRRKCKGNIWIIFWSVPVNKQILAQDCSRSGEVPHLRGLYISD